ncbi:MAG: type II toxin-antitoxin system RelE/ParE family toxin [Wenzhouxiangellaceae bacterium]
MTAVRIQARMSRQLDEIYQYTASHWGKEQAARYINGLFASFERIGVHGLLARPIPAEFGVAGYFYRYEKHIVYWKSLSNGDIGIVTILHERMHQIERLQDHFSG